MAKRKAPSDAEIQAIVRAELLACDTANGSLLAGDRAENMDYYQGRPFGNEMQGRSTVVSTDVRDAIEWIKPTLLRIFASGEDVVEFEPETVQDEPIAKQATEYVNYIWTRDNPGFQNFYYWFTDALLSKVGIAKIWWDDTPVEKRERYYGLGDQTFAALVNNKDVEVSEHTERKEAQPLPQPPGGPVGPDAAPAQAPETTVTVHDVVVTRTVGNGKVCVDIVPPEEFMISRAGRSMETARCVAHKRLRFTNELIEEGYPEELIRRLPGDELTVTLNIEEVARNTVEQIGVGQDTPPTSQNREVWVYEAYLKIDVDGDGIAEMRKITVAGAGFDILSNEPWDSPRPFCTLTPTPMPHRFWGISVADMLKDIQLIKSTLLRLGLDNKYLQINAREEVVESDIVDPQELLSSVPGQKIRVRRAGAINPIQVADVGESLLATLNYMDQVSEDRTGVSARTQGLGANDLHDTASGEKMLMSAAMGKIELIARVFAETGVRDAFKMILRLICAYQDKPRMIKLTGKWVQMDPTSWNEDMNMSVTVGIGTGDRDMKLQNAQMIMAMQEKAIQLDPSLVTPANLMASADIAINAMGLKSADKFFTPPQPGQPPPPKPPDPEMLKIQAQTQLQQSKQQGDMQIAQAKLQGDMQSESAKLSQQAEIAKMQAAFKAQTDQHLNQLEAQRRQLELESEAQLEQMKLQMTERLEIAKARIQQETAIITARIAAKATGGQIEEAEAAARDDELLGPARQSDVQAIMSKIDNLTNTTTAVAQTVSKPPIDPNTQPPHPAVVGALQSLGHMVAQGHTMAGDMHRQTMEAHAKVADALTAEKELVRDPKTGKPMGVRIKAKAQ